MDILEETSKNNNDDDDMKDPNDDNGAAAGVYYNSRQRELNLFAEKEEAFSCIESLSSTTTCIESLSSTTTNDVGDGNQQNNNGSNKSASLQRLAAIFDKYLECPTLLDPSLELLVETLAKIVLLHSSSCSAQHNDEDDAKELIDDPSTQHFFLKQDEPNKDSAGVPSTAAQVEAAEVSLLLIQYPLSALYSLSKVRGYKIVTRFLPHQVEHVEVIWQAMCQCKAAQQQQQEGRNNNLQPQSSTLETDGLPPIWESIYMLRHWLGVLSLVPFSYHVFENDTIHNHNNATETRTSSATATTTTTTTTSNNNSGFTVQKLLATTREELYEAGPVRDAAAVCLSAWLSRPDLEQQGQLADFIAWTKSVILMESPPSSSSSSFGDEEKSPASCSALPSHSHTNNSLFCLLGVCRTICHMLKRSSVARSKLIELLQPLWDPLLRLADDDSSAHKNNLLLTKLLNKWWTRMSCAYLPPRLAPWRYRRGQRSLFQTNQSTVTTSTTTAKHNVSELQANIIPVVAAGTADDDLFLVPDLVEDAMGRLLESLGHSSTVVRWSAAKGVGRITERLPSLCAEDVLDAILEMFKHYEKDKAWHGACLALAELARRGLLLPHRLSDVILHVVTAVHYDLRRGNNNTTSVGAHVRDAACYTFWAFARAYSPQVLRGHLKPLAQAVVLASLFDREINCRRAASAAFQEAVGRQGASSFPNGISIVTTADFFSLGNRKEAFTTIALKVAEFEEYRLPILKHLYQEKLFHWDVNIRNLASTSLSLLCQLDATFIGEHAMPFLLAKSLDKDNLSVRHGAVLGIAEMTRALSELGVLLSVTSESCRSSLVGLVGEIDKRRLYRGRGGEFMRSATCRLVECISLSNLPVAVKDQVKMLDTIDACISHPSEGVQESACSALGQLLSTYFPVAKTGPSERLQTRVVDKFIKNLRTSQNVAVTRGYALALGCLPAKLLAPSVDVLNRVLLTLRETARPDAKVGNEGDAETRRNALLSLSKIIGTIQTAGNHTTSYPVAVLNEKHMNGVLLVYLTSLEDYNTDRRGDVGSWCRMAALRGVADLLTVQRPTNELVDWCQIAETPTKVVGEILKQLGEKLDAVRLCAGEVIAKVLRDEGLAIINKLLIYRLLGFDSENAYNWSDPHNLFSNLLRVANLTCDQGDKPYFDKVLAGIVLSAGGLTSATSKEAMAALVSFSKTQKQQGDLNILGNSFIWLMKGNKSEARIIVPVLKTLSDLLLRQSFDFLVQDETSNFALTTCECLEYESKVSTDVQHLMLMADAAVALLRAMPSSQTCSRKILGLLCSILSSLYPRVRVHVSQHLYMVLQEQPNLVAEDCFNDVSNMIIDTSWGAELTIEEVTEIVSQIADKLDTT